MKDPITVLRAALASSRRRRSRRGMTLMEVMIVIVIILMLMGALTYGIMSAMSQSQTAVAELMINKANDRVQIYKLRKGKLPDDLAEAFKGEDPPKDPWGNPLVFRKGGSKGYDIVSFGADGKEGGTGNDADIKLSEIK